MKSIERTKVYFSDGFYFGIFLKQEYVYNNTFVIWWEYKLIFYLKIKINQGWLSQL